MKIQDLIQAALNEDVGRGDVTTRLTVPMSELARGRLVSRQRGVAAGIRVCGQVFGQYDAGLRFSGKVKDGSVVEPGRVLAEVRGAAGSILTAERTALNFLQRLSGIATLTSRFVAAVKDTKARILDTRKTTPGWRELEKYAVRCGGGQNHRMGLYDMVLIKDNHIEAAGSVTWALEKCLGRGHDVEVEVRNLAQLREALAAGARHVLLDNMTLGQMRRARQLAGPRVRLEASGRVDLRRVRGIAETGVDYISVGALTHSAPALDVALELERIP